MRRDISMMDAAFKALEAHEGSITFAELMGEVAKELEMSDEEKRKMFMEALQVDGSEKTQYDTAELQAPLPVKEEKEESINLLNKG